MQQQRPSTVRNKQILKYIYIYISPHTSQTNTGEGVERRELSCTVGGNGTVAIQNSMEVPEETKNTATK